MDIIPGPGGQTLWADVGLSEQMPLVALGDGMNRLARLVLAMAYENNVVVLIDEIENGFHRSVLDGVWRVVFETAAKLGTQVIATSHSYEAIRAACSMSSDHDLALHRLEAVDGQTKCLTYDAESLEGALTNGFEVR